MRFSITTILISVAFIMLLTLGCSGNNVTTPDMQGERYLSGGGNPGGDGDGPGGGPGNEGGPGDGPGPGFDVDCERLFDADYLVDFPCIEDVEATGDILIKDSDCDATESEVMVRFTLNFEEFNCFQMKRVIPGTKTVTDNGILYSGERAFSKEMWNHSVERLVEYELLVYETDEGTVIEGTLYRYMHMIWTKPSGEEMEKEREWFVDVTGIENTD